MLTLVFQFSQGSYIASLPPPNDSGVCFSLSIEWLAGGCEPTILGAVASDVNRFYGAKSAHRMNKIQRVANTNVGDVGGIAQAVMEAGYSMQRLPDVILGDLSLEKLKGTFAARMRGQSGIVWLFGEGGRGHVVAFNAPSSRFFDANFGVYLSNANFGDDVAENIMGSYGRSYGKFMLVLLDIRVAS